MTISRPSTVRIVTFTRRMDSTSAYRRSRPGRAVTVWRINLARQKPDVLPGRLVKQTQIKKARQGKRRSEADA